MTHETETPPETFAPTLADLRNTLLRQAQDLDHTFQTSLRRAETSSNTYYAVALKSQVQFRQCLEYLLKVKALQKKSSKSTNELLKATRKDDE